MKTACQNLLLLDILHYHVYIAMHLSSSIKLKPFCELHLVLLEEHCATSCLVMAGCGAKAQLPCGGILIQVELPQDDLLDPCAETNAQMFLWSFDISGYLGIIFQRSTLESAKSCFSRLSPSNINFLPYANCPPVLQSPFKWTIWALGGKRPSSVDSASFLATVMAKSSEFLRSKALFPQYHC